MFLSSVIEQVPRSLEERGGGAGHTPLPSVASEISRSLNQCRRRNAFDSALCLHGFHGLQTISGSSFQIYLLSVCCVLGVRVWRAYYWIIYLKGIWAQVREGSEGILGGGFWYILSTLDFSLSSMNLRSNSCFLHTSCSPLPHYLNW